MYDVYEGDYFNIIVLTSAVCQDPYWIRIQEHCGSGSKSHKILDPQHGYTFFCILILFSLNCMKTKKMYTNSIQTVCVFV